MGITQGLDEVTTNTRQKSKIFYSGTLMELLAGAEPPAQESEPWANTHRQEHLRGQAAEG